MQQNFNNLYDAWLEDYHSNFETQFEDPIVKRYCFWHGGTQEGVEGKGKTFNAAYEILIYAFFLGLYSGQGRRPLVGKKRNLSMEMKHWRNINTKLFKERKKYDQIQKYIFAALIAKTDIDLIAIDRGDLSIEKGVEELQLTLSEYINTGFYLMQEKMNDIPDFFDGEQSFLSFISKYASKM